MTETLWVEPRLRGFAVTDDRRNPPGTAGRFIPYDTGWGALHRGMGDVPREDGVEPLRGVRLRVSSDAMRKLARRAMERDFASRIRDGVLHCTVKTPTWRRWMPWGVLALGAFFVVMGVFVASWRAPGLISAVWFPVMALLLWSSTKIDVTSIGVDGDKLVIERLDGRTERRALGTIEYMTPGLGGALVRFTDQSTVRFDVNGFPARTLFRTLRRVYAPHAEEQDTRDAHRALKRSAVIYWPIGCVLIGVAHWYLGASNGWQIPGYPVLSAVVSSVGICLGLAGVFALQAFLFPALAKWNENRDWRRERQRMKAGRAVRERGAAAEDPTPAAQGVSA